MNYAMDACVSFREGAFYVELSVDADFVDECGPFDDRWDAEMAAERAIRIGA